MYFVGSRRGKVAAAVLASLVAAIGVRTARSDVTTTGGVIPSNPAAWTSATVGYVGYSTDGGLSISAGSNLPSNLDIIGNQAGATGTVSVDGAGSTWYGSTLAVGCAGTGNMAITNGGLVSIPTNYIGQLAGSNGTVTVSGVGSSWVGSDSVYVGYAGAGMLNVTGGATVSGGFSGIGYLGGSTGLATVDGAGSTWNVGGISVGGHGNGSLRIANGGSLSSGQNAVIGEFGVGSLNVDGFGSTFTNRFELDVGYYGTGTMTVTNGGTVIGGNETYVGYTENDSGGASGILTVSGAGSTLTSGFLYIGYGGAGTLNVLNGATVSSRDTTLGNERSYTGGNMTGTATVSGSGSTWTLQGLIVGDASAGTLSITNGATVSSSYGYIGRSSTSTVTVDGLGSAWNVGYQLDLGIYHGGIGTLYITNGGAVTVSHPTLIFSGTIVFGNNGGVFSTGSLYAAAAQVTGTGTINARGMVNDGDLVFDSTHGLTQTLNWTGANQNVTIHLDVSGASGAVGDLGAGFRNSGTLTIRDGVAVSSVNGELGYLWGAMGTATVSGPGSKWTTNALTVGDRGTGTLSIVNGGTVSASTVSVGTASIVAMSVGDGSALSAGAGSLTNSGVIRLNAVAEAVDGSSYSPIAAGSWSGTGVVQAVGGTWDPVAHVFTVSAEVAGVGTVTIDPSQIQRAVVTDAGTGKTVLAEFLAASSSSSLTFTATTLTGGQVGLLQNLLGTSGPVVAGWTFGASGYTAGNPVYLAMDIGPGYAAENLTVWHFDGAAWSSYAASDFSYDREWANFTVTGFSGYAVAVPEAGTLGVVAVGAVGLMGRRRRRAG